MSAAVAFEFQRDRIADALGRLYLRLEGDEVGRFLVERAANALDSLDAIVQPTAGELVAEGFEVDEALAIVEGLAAALHSRPGLKKS